MYFKIILSVVLLGCVVFMVRYFVTSPKTLINDTTPTSLPVIPTNYVREPGTFLTKNGTQLPATSLVENKGTTAIKPGFYENSNDIDVFGVYYLESTGNLTITLYDEDTKAARLQAEEYIKDVLPYTENELCLLDVTVITNEYVNPTYAGLNLGFSFCPGTVVIP